MYRQVPNALTISRAVLAVMGASLMVHPKLAFWLFMAAATSDLVDGPLARRLKATSLLGMLLDPVADGVLAVAGIVGLLATGWLPVWAIYILAALTVSNLWVMSWTERNRSRGRLILATLFQGVYELIGVGFASRAFGWHRYYWPLLLLAALIVAICERKRIIRWARAW